MSYTIKDIAEKAGVSTTTVSLILNDKKCRVSDETRARVLEIAKKYNYSPNFSARALVTKKTNTLGLIIPDISNPFFAELSKGIEEEAQKNNYSVIFCNSNQQAKKDVSNLSLLISKQIDGLIISTSLYDSDDEYISQFNRLVFRSNLPVVAVDRDIPKKEYDIVSLDHLEGGFIATNHLLQLEHKRIGCITGPFDSASARERYNGYLNALEMFKIDFNEDYVYHGNYQIDSGFNGAKKLIENGVSAIFACNDLMACGVYRQAALMGKKIGKDLSVIGYDDIPLCEVLEQPLTTINQPVNRMGRNACKILIDIISGPQYKKQNIKFSPSLIERDSTSQYEGNTI